MRREISSMLHDKGAIQIRLQEKTRLYFEKWMVFTTIAENNRTEIKATSTFFCEWKFASNGNKMFQQNAWRFESIVSALLYASVLFNRSVMEKENQEMSGPRPWLDSMIECYSLLRNVCLTNILAWKLRRECILPFECTENGCKTLMGMCLVEIQHHTIHYSIQSKKDYKNIFKMNHWIYQKTQAIESYISCRIADGSIVDHSWKCASTDYNTEAAINMFFYYACHLDDTAQEYPDACAQIKIVQFILSCALKMHDLFMEKQKNWFGSKPKIPRDAALESRLENIRKNAQIIEDRCKKLLDANGHLFLSQEYSSSVDQLDPRKYLAVEWMESSFYIDPKTCIFEDDYDKYSRLSVERAEEHRRKLFE